MKASDLAVLGGLTALAGVGGFLLWKQGKPLIPARSFEPRILIGDSLAVGLAPTLRRLGAITESRAITGTTLRAWLARQDLPRGKYLISLGTNDMPIGGVAAEQVRAMNEKLGDAVWILPPLMPFTTYEDTVRVLRQNGRTINPPSDLPRAEDKIHLPPAGYQRWAAAIDAALRQM